jgi:hypothetical protein
LFASFVRSANFRGSVSPRRSNERFIENDFYASVREPCSFSAVALFSTQFMDLTGCSIWPILLIKNQTVNVIRFATTAHVLPRPLPARPEDPL